MSAAWNFQHPGKRLRYLNKWPAFLLLLLPFAAFAQTDSTVFYVSPEGKATNPGTLERPFGTPRQARDAVRKAKATNPQQRITVYFRGGAYPLNESFELTSADSGSVGFPVKYAVYQREKPFFNGGRVLDPGKFLPVTDPDMLQRLPAEVRGKVREIDLKKIGINDFGMLRQHGFGIVPEPAPLELFIDGERQPLARYPNEGRLPVGRVYDPGSVPRQGDFSNRGAEFGYEYERPARWLKATDIWLHGHFSFGYNDDHLPLARIDTARKTLVTALPHIYGVVSSVYVDTSKWSDLAGQSLRGYYVYNLPEEIDQPGEWYLDRLKGKLYLYPPANFATARIEVSLLEAPLFSLRQTAHILIEGFEFNTSRGMGIYLENAHHIGIASCTFSGLGTVAISAGQPLQNNPQQYASDGSPVLDRWVSQDFHHLSISDCRISRTGTGGIILTGGDRRTLTASGNEISRCELSRVDERNHTYAAAVKLFGVSVNVNHCHFHDLRHAAIVFRGNDHLIEHNLFERICTYADDMGAVYSGRDPSSLGTAIHNNYFRDVLPVDQDSQTGAVFLDDGICGTEVSGNFFERVGSTGDKELFGAVFIHGGYGNNVHHNVFMDCQMAVGNNYWPDEKWKSWLEGRIIKERMLQEVDVTSPAFQQKYPLLKDFFASPGPRLNRVAENYLINSNMAINGKYELYFNHLETRENLQKALKKIKYEEEHVGPAH